MDIKTINNYIDNLYDQKWANLNAWYPIGLYIPGVTVSGETLKFDTARSAVDTYKILGGLSSNKSLFVDGGFKSSYPALERIVSITGIPNSSAGFKQEKAGLKENADKNYASIGIKFYLEQDIFTWRFMQAWRSKWKSISMKKPDAKAVEIILNSTAGEDGDGSSDGSTLDKLSENTSIGKFENTIKTNGMQSLPEGYLEMAHVYIEESSVKDLGTLKITGLIPTEIPFIGEIGPGRSRSSDIPTLDCKFTASNIIYFDSKGNATQFY